MKEICVAHKHSWHERIWLKMLRIKSKILPWKTDGCFSFSFCPRWHRSARKGPYTLHPVSQQSSQGCPRNSAIICLVEHRLVPTLEGVSSATSFLHSSFLQVIYSLIYSLTLWLVHVQKVPQTSEPLCPTKLQTSRDICCANQSVCLFIPTDSGVPRAVDPQQSLQPKTVHAEDKHWETM